MNALELQQIQKTYQSKAGPVKALDDVSFSIKKGELFGLLGPNGAGKSTLINILGGVVQKTGGTALVNGIDIDKDHRQAKMQLGIVGQEISFDAFLTVQQALELQFGYYNLPIDKEHMHNVLKTLALEDKFTSNPRWLSGGMKRRFMIARAMMHKPDILILDEPTAGVDVELRHDMYDLIRALHDAGTTIILTTHYLEEVELLAQRVGILKKGKLVALDDKQELKERFQSTRQLKIAITKPLDTMNESLRPFDPQVKEGELLLTFEEKEYKQVLQAVASADLPVAHFTVIEPTIEDVFISLTND